MRAAFLAAANSWHTVRWVRAVQSGVEVHAYSFDPNPFMTDDECTVISSRVPNKLRYIFGEEDYRRCLEKFKPDIVHSHYATGYGFVGAKINQHPFVVSVWGSDIFDWPTKSPLHKYFLQWILGRADAVCATSQKLYEGTVKVFPQFESKVRVIPFGIDMNLFKPAQIGGDKNEVVLGTVRKFDKIYQLDLLMEVFDELSADFDNLQLKIAGEGPERENLLNLRQSLKSKEKIEILPFIPNDKLPGFLNSLDIFAIPSKFESYGVAALEAGACGLPVAGFAVGGLTEIVRDGESGYLVEKNNRSALKSALVKLIEDSELRKKLGRRGRELALQKADIKASADLLIDLYQKLL